MASRGGVISLDSRKEEARIARFIRKVVSDAGANGVVVGLSGGVDSSVVGELCVRSLGMERVTGLMMPSEHTPAADMADAGEMARRLGIRTLSVGIQSIVGTLVSSVRTRGSRIADANAQARVRMAILYYVANARGLLVAGTGDRSEIEIGYFTKFGDGGADFLPIGHLYKTQVRQLGAYLGLPEEVFNKPSSPQLWSAHTAEEELPVGYEKLDLVLHYMCDRGMGEAKTAERAGVGVQTVREVSKRRRDSAHKRALPMKLAVR